MSAIFGLVRRDGAMVAGRDLDRLADALRYRALDGLTREPLGIAAFGHALAHVTHEDAFEVQPLHDAGRDLWLVADARIDNRADLAEALGIAAPALARMPDSALILAAWHRWSEDCPQHLLGDFAFAIWDADARRLFLARDPMGQRDLFYYIVEGFVAFATDGTAIRALPDVPREISDATIAKMLMHEMSAPEDAVVAGQITGLPGGGTLTIDRAAPPVLRRYWSPHADPQHVGRDEAYYVAAYRRVLGEAVACRLRRLARPAGLKLSGGYDSAAIAGLAGAPLGQGGTLVAASSVMPADYRGDIRHARRWVELCARDMPWLDVHWVTREGIDALTGLEERFATLQSSGGSYGFVNEALWAALAVGGARLAMDGHGGDYTLNPRGQAALARHLKTGRIGRFAREFRAHRRATGAGLWDTLRNAVIKHAAPHLLRSYRRARRHPPWQDQPVRREFARRMIAEGAVDPAKLRVAPRDQTAMRARLTDVVERIGHNTGASAMPARHGLTLTRPFHDRRVVELALAIPEDLYLRDGRSRYLACRALADIYPPEFQTRWRLNDDEIPDFQRMVSGIKPRLLDDIARMERSERLSAMIDFPKIRALLDARAPDDHNSGWEQETQLALSGYMAARFLEWFRRDNG